MPENELAKALQEAKKKPRNFALIAKGPNVVHLLIQKKPIQPALLQKLKQEYGGKDTVKGVVEGGEGAEMVFRVAEAAPVGEVKLRTYITDTAELHLKPRFEVVEGLKEIDDEATLPTPSTETKPKETSESSESESDEKERVVEETGKKPVDQSGPFQERLKKLKPNMKRVKNAGGAEAKEMEPLVGQMAVLAKKSNFGDALGKLVEIEKIVERGLNGLLELAKKGMGKVTSGAKSSLSEENAKELTERMDDAIAKCPALADHLAKTMGGVGGASIYFSDTAKDAFYTSKGDKVRGVPDHVIILPTKGKTPQDLLDGLLFETCNAEIQHEYDALTKSYVASLEGTPTDTQDFGKQKATIEAKCVLKNVQLLFQARKSKVDVAYQGNRNLLAMLRTCFEQEGSTLPDYDKIIEDPVLLNETLAKHEEKLGAFLDGADKEPSIRESVLTAMANTPHNRNCTNPTDKNGLKTCDLYAYELLETAPGQVAQMIEYEIGKVIDLGTLPMDELRPWLVDRVSRFDGSDKSARQTMVKRIIADVKKMYPELADAKFSCLDFSPEMEKMAEVRMSDYKSKNAKQFEKAKRDAFGFALERLNGAMLPSIDFLNTFQADVQKDTGPALAILGELSALKGIPKVITDITQKQTSEPPVLSKKDAELIGNSLQEAIVNALDAYNEHAMALDVDEGKLPALKESAVKMANAVNVLPPRISKPMQMPLKFFLIAAEDLISL